MQQSRWEVNRYSVEKKLTVFLPNPKIHYQIHKRQPPAHILNDVFLDIAFNP